jgi:hypothetical protein
MLVVASLLVPTALVTAQNSPVTIRLSPTPNQTFRTHTSQETTMTSEQEPAVPGQASAPQNVHMTMTMDTTSTVGPSDPQGHYESHVVFDSIASTATMNEKPMNMPYPNAAGTAFTLFYDELGKTIDMTGEGALTGDAATALKQVMTSVMASPAPLTLAVGESVTVPGGFKMPLPSGASSAPGGAMTTTGETKYTLSSITFDGADRIAHLTTKKTLAMSTGSPGNGASEFKLEQRITGDGTMDVNIDRGLTIHTAERINIDGTSRIAARSGSTERSMRMHGTMTLNTDLVK